MLRTNSKETFLYELLEVLLKKNAEDISPAMAPMLSGVVMTILAKLREQKLPSDSRSFSARDLPVDQLHTILSGIVDGILRGGAGPSTRGYFYAALLNYLKLCTIQLDKTHFSDSNQSEQDSTKLFRLRDVEGQQRMLDNRNFEILSGAPNFIQTIARDGNSLFFI